MHVLQLILTDTSKKYCPQVIFSFIVNLKRMLQIFKTRSLSNEHYEHPLAERKD